LDGRRVLLGLPAALLRGLHTAAAPSGADHASAQSDQSADPDAVLAPVSGTLQGWQVAAGETVHEGQQIAVMQAMKMEIALHAHRAGMVDALVDAGTAYAAGTVLARVR